MNWKYYIDNHNLYILNKTVFLSHYYPPVTIGKYLGENLGITDGRHSRWPWRGRGQLHLAVAPTAPPPTCLEHLGRLALPVD